MKNKLNITNTKVLKVFLFACLFLSFNLKHPFYLSVTELKYDLKAKSLQASVKLFTNDIEDALKRINKKPIDLINGKDKELNNKVLTEYIKRHLLIKVSGKLQVLNFIGYEIEEEAVWIYAEYKNCPVPKKLEIENTLLFDFIETQTNIVNCEYNSGKKNYKVTNPDKLVKFEF